MKLKSIVAAIVAAGFALPMVASAGEAVKGGSMSQGELIILAQAEDRFDMLDTNQDGVIDREEAAADPDVAAAFDEIDVAGTGEITLEEFSAWEEVSEPAEPGLAPQD